MSRIGCLPGRQPKRDIHAYTHPDWCQRGCLITIFRHACVLGCAQLHHISTQTLRHIHTYMHPQWGQRGCLVLSALLRFFAVVGLDCLRCTAAHVCMDVLRCTAWYAADAHHSCVHAPALVTRYASPFVAMDFSCLLGSAPLRYICNYADDAHIHTNMHPQWCQRGCLVPYWYCDFLLWWDWLRKK